MSSPWPGPEQSGPPGSSWWGRLRGPTAEHRAECDLSGPPRGEAWRPICLSHSRMCCTWLGGRQYLHAKRKKSCTSQTLKSVMLHSFFKKVRSVSFVLTDPIRSCVMKRDKASFVLSIDISPMLQQILCHLQVVVTSYEWWTASNTSIYTFFNLTIML